jgi:hypothetical protein
VAAGEVVPIPTARAAPGANFWNFFPENRVLASWMDGSDGLALRPVQLRPYFRRCEFLEKNSRKSGWQARHKCKVGAPGTLTSDQRQGPGPLHIRSKPLTPSSALFLFNSAAENGPFFF